MKVRVVPREANNVFVHGKVGVIEHPDGQLYSFVAASTTEAETFWSTFLKSLVKRGLRGVKLVISDAHDGLTAAINRVVGATWQRCRVHFMRNA